MQCRDCKKLLSADNRHGYCYHCASGHQCNVCGEVRHPRFMFHGSVCWGCQVRVIERMKQVHWFGGARPESAEWAAVIEARVRRYMRRARRGKPLFCAG